VTALPEMAQIRGDLRASKPGARTDLHDESARREPVLFAVVRWPRGDNPIRKVNDACDRAEFGAV
jgi:hypothetical protein